MIDAVVDFIKEYPMLGIPVIAGLLVLLVEALFHRR